MTLSSSSSSEADTSSPGYLSPVGLCLPGSHTHPDRNKVLGKEISPPVYSQHQTGCIRPNLTTTHIKYKDTKQPRVNSNIETFSFRGLKNKYVCNPTTMRRTQNVNPADSLVAQGKFQVQVLSKEIKSKPVDTPQYPR